MNPSVLFFAFTFIWLLVQIRRLFFHISVFQLKEFRFDRYFSWLKTQEGLNILLHPWSLIKYILLIFLFWPKLFSFCFYGFFSIYLWESVYALFEIITWRFKRPRLTIKITILIALSIIVAAVIASIAIIHTTNWLTNLSLFNNQLVKQLLIIDRLLILIIMVEVVLLNILNNILRRRAYEKLSQLLNKNKGLKIIAITGSYGKTSTKNFLHTLLTGHIPLITVPQNINTEIGIANFILENLHSSHKIIIVEIGAYKKGEIEHIGSILKPDISILTAISNQHLDLFGSQQNIIEAKFEIGKILNPKGTLIINSDSRLIMSYINRFQKIRPDVKIRTVSIQKSANYYATQISNTPLNGPSQGTSFTLNTKNLTIELKTHLVSPSFITNLLLAIAAAREINVKISHIVSKIVCISQPDHTLRIYKNPLKNNIIIDDSYSANEIGILEAINIAAKSRLKNKIVIFRPLIELGKDSDRTHQKIASKMSKVFTYIIATSYDYVNIITEVLKKSGFNMNRFLVIKNDRRLLSLVKTIANKNSLILMENRIPERIVLYLMSKSCEHLPNPQKSHKESRL